MNFRSFKLLVALLAALLMVTGGAYAATWSETGDAGTLLGDAQVTLGSGALDQISGSFSTLSDIDLYKIQITDHASFTATTGTGYDPML